MGNEGLSWLDRWRLYRDRLIASPRVQRWALANPLTRPVAQRRARAMLDLCAGFVYSQVLFTCVRLRLFDILFKEPLTIAALAERLLLSPEATSRLLDAAVSLGLVERRGRSVYGLGQLGAALAGNRAALSLIEHQPLLYADLQDPVALLRGSSRGYGDRSLLALLGGRASNGADGRGGRALQRAHGRIAASHCAGSAQLLPNPPASLPSRRWRWRRSFPRRGGNAGTGPTPHASRPARCGQTGSCPAR